MEVVDRVKLLERITSSPIELSQSTLAFSANRNLFVIQFGGVYSGMRKLSTVLKTQQNVENDMTKSALGANKLATARISFSTGITDSTGLYLFCEKGWCEMMSPLTMSLEKEKKL